ncbi:hypothetical protein [Mycoplasmopsis bovirhinis]|uniref:hypothetical protein n=1 Tax=Mycoplasmopsis bovirhinis TaxID=29553 RepID=UPI0012FDC191|nr:hypothetical protein [Mycoplasmopsis bovirhinis]
MRRGLKYSLIFLGSALLIVPTSLYTLYRIEHKEWTEHSKIYFNNYWNDNHTLYTLEGAYPSTFYKDNDRISKDKQVEPSSAWEYGNNPERIDKDADNWVYSKENVQNTTYLFKTKKEFIDLFLNLQPERYVDENTITKQYKELLDKVDFAQQDIILLNNYVNIFMPRDGDRRKLGWDIKEYSYNDSNKTLTLKWDENYEQKQYWWKSNCKWGCAVDKALGSNYWYRSFFIIVDKTSLNDYKDLKIEMEYEWLK